MRPNLYSWNEISNMLYLYSPVRTGFSKSHRNDTYTDKTATLDNMKALLQFFIKFPSYKKNDFFITG
jgi:carboxypeptidase C (cathepsin A)